ncbi:MAG: hypothetical protein COB37_06585 [Kordiimonadales bacterium]|nr:MAG: hypothetical protein COB37_06585 [Kordiimonadales bacterium]
MADQFIFIPVLIQIFLTLMLYVALLKRKKKAAADKTVDLERRGLHNDAWPDTVLQVNNNIRNQFEVPVLFYALIMVLWSLEAINIYAHALAWIFVLTRLVHAYVHTGSNFVPLRLRMFSFGIYSVLGMIVLAGVAIAA